MSLLSYVKWKAVSSTFNSEIMLHYEVNMTTCFSVCEVTNNVHCYQQL